MNQPKALRTRLIAGEQVFGGIVRIPGEDVIDMLGVAGLDFVLIDCEHGPSDVVALRQHIAFAQVHGMAVLVRTAENEPHLVQRALDQGSQGVVIAHVDTAEQAETALRSAHYPPRGTRGFATYPRAGRFGTVDPAAHTARLAEETLVIAMLESPDAVRNADSILAVEGLDGYLVGTADLAAASTDSDLSVLQSLETVRAAGLYHGSWRCDIVNDTDSAAAAFDAGAQLVLYNLAAVMMTAFRQLRVR